MAITFDHFYMCLNSDDFKQFECKCQFLDLFEKRTTVRKDMTYTGYYLYFDNNLYFEIISSDCGIKPHMSGIALSDLEHNDGVIEQVRKDKSFCKSTMTKGEEPWFNCLHVDWASEEYVSIWLMEYQGRFLSERLSRKKNSKLELISVSQKNHLSVENLNHRLKMYCPNLSTSSHSQFFYSQGEPKAEVKFQCGNKQLKVIC